MKLIQQGAEAKIYLNKNQILKNRLPKSYRHPQLDNQIRIRRTRAESKILTKAAQAKVNVPKVLARNTETPKHRNTDKFHIYMEFIPGDRLSQALNDYPESKQLFTMQKLGRQTAKLHANNIIHSDLTTSNIILTPTTRKSKIFLIDFGLSYISNKIENKAVDLHLLKQALQAKHFQNSKKLFTAFKKGYKFEDSKTIIERLTIVEKRGRYKH